MGGNEGKREELLREATDLIRQRVGSVVDCSRVYETAPWGVFDSEEVRPFLNMAVHVSTALDAHQCLEQCLKIEGLLGRRRKETAGTPEGGRIYSNRPIDIDLILFNDETIDTPSLTIPHPRMHLRRFVLEPLNDIAPEVVHPLLNKNISQLLSLCEDDCFCCVYCFSL